MKIIHERKANIIITPRDLNYFTSRYFPIDDYISHGIKFSIATGWLGEDLLKDMRLFRNKYKELDLSSEQLFHSITKTPFNLYFGNNSDGESCYSIEINKPATFAFIDMSDIRFSFFPEELSYESICDFLVDNLTSYSFTDIMIKGEFKVRDSMLKDIDENELIEKVNSTRERLYKTGRYDELKKKRRNRENSEKLDLATRSDDEIKLFSEENSAQNETASGKDEFRIKTKIPVFRPKKNPSQRSLFEEFEHVSIIQAEDSQVTPMLNLLVTDPDSSKPVEDDIIQVKNVDETIFRRLTSEKKPDPVKNVKTESKIELPKNVKLKFGDD